MGAFHRTVKRKVQPKYGYMTISVDGSVFVLPYDFGERAYKAKRSLEVRDAYDCGGVEVRSGKRWFFVPFARNFP
jgi:hypothetical protein